MSNVQIDLENVSFSYEKRIDILENINFHASGQESIGLIGANGVGKSTLLKLLVGLQMPTSGSILISGIPIEKKTLPQIRRQIGYVFQDSDSQLFLSTAYEDIAFAPRNYGLSETEVEARVQQALERIGGTYLRDKKIYKMSGGEKKLVSIATILSMTPDIILMDEPSTALDPRNRRQLIHILNASQHLKIIASHDLDLILETCSRVILLSQGKIICDAPAREVLTDQKLLEENGLELPFCLQKPSFYA